MSKNSKKSSDRRASKPDPLSGFINRALMLHQQGQLVEACKLYDYVLARNSEHVDALHMLGVVRIQEGDVGVGIALIESALKIQPNDASAWLNLGNGQNALKHYAQALVSFDRSLSLAPDNANAHN